MLEEKILVSIKYANNFDYIFEPNIKMKYTPAYQGFINAGIVTSEDPPTV